MRGFAAHFLASSAIAAALEAGWLASLGVKLGAGLVLALVGSNALLQIGLVTAARVLWRWSRTGERLAAIRARGLRQTLVAWAPGIFSALPGAALLAAGSYFTVQWAYGSIATESYRPAFTAIATVLMTGAVLAVVPMVRSGVGRLLGRLGPRVTFGIVTALSLAALVGALVALVLARSILVELDRRSIFTPLFPAVATLLGALAARPLARRTPLRALQGAVAALGVVAAAGCGMALAHESLLGTIGTKGLQSRWASGIAPAHAAVPPGSRDRVFLEQGPLTAPAHPPRNVVVISIDALRADHAYRRGLMPNVERVFARGTRFEAAFCAVGSSLRSLPTLITGKYTNALVWRKPGRVGIDPWRTSTLAKILDRRRFDTMWVTHTSYVSNAGTRNGFQYVFEPQRMLGPDWKDEFQPRDGEMVDAVIDAWPIPRADRRLYLWVHLYDPHNPYFEYEPARHETPIQLYDDEVRRTDAAVGKLIRFLEGKGVLDDAILVITSDHGEEFGEHGARYHGYTPHLASSRVPLVIAVPGGHARRVGRPVTHADLVPTILNLLGLPVPNDLDGISLADTVLRGTPPPIRSIITQTFPLNADTPRAFAVIRERWKLHANAAGIATELYDYRADPAERSNVLERHREIADELAADLSTYRRRGNSRPIP